jgi:hypothetical protein
MSRNDPLSLFEQAYDGEVAVVETAEAAERAAIEAQLTALQQKKDDALADWLRRVIRRAYEKLCELDHHHHPRQIVLLPQYFTDLHTGAVIPMADIQLPLNNAYTAVITEYNPTTQAFDPVSSTDVFTATPSDTTNMSATVARFVPPAGATASQQALAGIPAVTVQWLHTVSPLLVGVGVTITDSAGSSPVTLEFDMLAPNTVPDQIGVDSADAVFTPIPTPV